MPSMTRQEVQQIAADPFFAVPQTEFDTSVGPVKLPILYYDNSHILALFKGDPDAVSAMLEGTGLVPALHVGKKPLIIVAMYEYRETSIGPYNEVGVGVAVYREGYEGSRSPLKWVELIMPPGRRDQGAYVLDLPVTTQAAFAAGSELWGYPKFVAPIPFELGAGRCRCAVEDPDDGSTIMEFAGKAFPTLPIPPSPLVLYSHKDDQMLRAHVDVRNGLQVHAPGKVRLTVGASKHRMANNLRDLGLDGAKPLVVASTDKFQSRLNAGLVLTES